MEKRSLGSILLLLASCSIAAALVSAESLAAQSSVVTLKGGRIRAPSPEEARRIGAGQQRLFAAKALRSDPVLSPYLHPKLEVLPDGTRGIRLPLERLSYTMAGRIDTPAARSPAGALPRATFVVDEDRLQGADRLGRPLLFTPDPLVAGSSIAHWDPSATPDLLMEPFISSDLAVGELDLTLGVLQDLGWQTGEASIRLVSLDPPGIGFQDPRPFAGAPGNEAATLGEARREVFEALVDVWARSLQSTVEIEVVVAWRPLFCEAGVGAVIAAAGPTTFYRDGPGFPAASTWYPAALAEAFAGRDLTGPASEHGGDVLLIANSQLDEGCLAPGSGIYYGLDGAEPPLHVDMAPVVLHELGHGLGMLTTTDPFSGEEVQGAPSVYDLFLVDTDTGRSWPELDAASRAESASSFRRLAWSGAAARAEAATTLASGRRHLRVDAPAEVAGSYEIALPDLGPLPTDGLAGEVACLQNRLDAGVRFDGCTEASNPTELAGRIALVEGGGCSHATKIRHAEAAGATAALVVELSSASPFELHGAVDSGIPAAALGRRDGLRLRQAACGEDALLLLGSRFQVTARWATSGRAGGARATAMSDRAGYFTFFKPDNPELVLKILDTCSDRERPRFSVFAAGLTNVEVELEVVDLWTGRTATYFNPASRLFEPVADSASFPCF